MKLNSVTTLQTCYMVYKYYEDILNSYVSDYYVDSHWNKLSKSWQKHFDNIELNEVAELLDLTKNATVKVISPLSLLCLRNLVIYNTLPRKNISYVDHIIEDEMFIKYLWKKVKLKKRHEINALAQMCYKMAVQTGCFYIVDIGSGLGHLSRMLSYGYGFNVCTFEADSTLSCLAEKMDKNFENILKSKDMIHQNTCTTIHINKKIESNLLPCDFINLVKNAFQKTDTNFKFGIVGLHPCGDLGSTLLRLYNESPNAAFINIASCCYMKLTLQPPLPTLIDPLLNIGFPLSRYCKDNSFKLTYLSCEIACHAIENYVKKLKDPNNVCELKIHAYRAALEKVVISVDEKHKHSAVCGVKYTNNLCFKTYCDKVLHKFGIILSNDITSLHDEIINKTWKNVIVFYSVRLLLAPLVETIILLDRLLYTEECKSDCDILPLFDCLISPRNHVLSARKQQK